MISMDWRNIWPVKASARRNGRGWCTHESHSEKPGKKRVYFHVRSPSRRWPWHAVLAAQPHANSEATPEHRGKRNNVARNCCAPEADRPTARFLDCDERGAVRRGAARTSWRSGEADIG